MKLWINFKAFRDERRYWDKCLLSFVEWGKNMLTNFLMASPGGLDFCLANVFLECISVFSYSCPDSYQRPVNVCVQGEGCSVCGQFACFPLTGSKLDSAPRGDAACWCGWWCTWKKITWLHAVWTKSGGMLTYRICEAATFPSLFNYKNKTNSFKMCHITQQTCETIHLHQTQKRSGQTSPANQLCNPSILFNFNVCSGDPLTIISNNNRALNVLTA